MSAINKKNKSVSSSLQTQQDKTSMLDGSHTNSHQLGGHIKIHQQVEQPEKVGSNLVHRQAVIANIGQALGNTHLQRVLTQPTSEPSAISNRVQHTNVIARQGNPAKANNAYPTLSTPSKQDTGFGEVLQKIITQEGGITVAIYVSKKSGFTDQSTFQTQASSFAKDHQAVGVIGNQLVIGSAMPATTAADVVRDIQNSLSLVREITGQKAVRISTFAIFTHGLNDYLNLGKGNKISGNTLDKQAKDESEQVKDFVAAVDSALSDTARVVMYSCLTASTYVPIPKKEKEGQYKVAPQTIAQDIRTGGEGSFADKLRDALTASGQKREVWGHRTRGHTTRNPNWRLFAGVQSGETASTPLFGEDTDVTLDGIKDPQKPRSYSEQQKLSKTGVSTAANAVQKLVNAIQVQLEQDKNQASSKKHRKVKASNELKIWVGRETPFVPPHMRPYFDDKNFSEELIQWFVKRYYQHHSESKPLTHILEQESLHESTQITKPAQQGLVGDSKSQSPTKKKADSGVASNAKPPTPPSIATTNAPKNAFVNEGKGDVKQRGLNHVIERNSEFASLLGWYSQIDKIVAYFQKLGLLPPHQSPIPEGFAKAVKSFQRLHPTLKDDGILGSTTWQILQDEIWSESLSLSQHDDQTTPSEPLSSPASHQVEEAGQNLGTSESNITKAPISSVKPPGNLVGDVDSDEVSQNMSRDFQVHSSTESILYINVPGFIAGMGYEQKRMSAIFNPLKKGWKKVNPKYKAMVKDPNNITARNEFNMAMQDFEATEGKSVRERVRNYWSKKKNNPNAAQIAINIMNPDLVPALIPQSRQKEQVLFDGYHVEYETHHQSRMTYHSEAFNRKKFVPPKIPNLITNKQSDSGKQTLNPIYDSLLKQGASTSEAKILAAISGGEGRFHTTQAVDRVRFSWGMIQFQGASLMRVLKYMRSSDPEYFRKHFEAYGIVIRQKDTSITPSNRKSRYIPGEVQGVPISEALDVEDLLVYDHTTKTWVYGNEGLAIIQADPRYQTLFAVAGNQTVGQTAQLLEALHNYARGVRKMKVLLGTGKNKKQFQVKDIINSEIGMFPLVDLRIHGHVLNWVTPMITQYMQKTNNESFDISSIDQSSLAKFIFNFSQQQPVRWHLTKNLNQKGIPELLANAYTGT